MRVIQSLEDLGSVSTGLVLAAGVFDGFHLGHRAVVDRAHSFAREIGGVCGVLSFDVHPASVLRPDSCPPLIATRLQKQKLLSSHAVEIFLEIPFTPGFASQEAEVFIRHLYDSAKGKFAGISVGRSWSFGRGRSGGVPLLTALGNELNFKVIAVDPVLAGGIPVSSTRIRQALAEGNLHEAEACLRRSYSISGQVVSGERLGRTLGFPTANIASENEILLPNGVYAAQVLRAGVCYQAAVNIGNRPTVKPQNQKPGLEAFLIDFEDDLYGEELEVRFICRIRSEKRFPGIAELSRQIARDVEQIREILTSQGDVTP